MQKFLLKSKVHGTLAEIFYNDIISRRSSYFYYIGKIVDWLNSNDPDVPLNTGEYEYVTRNEIISVKKILPQDVAFVIDRIDWESGTVYDQYDPNYSDEFLSSTGASSLEDSKFYVLSEYQGIHYNVYKCLFNNNGAESTERPTGSDATAITYSDGYIWKYMYTIPLSMRNKFLTHDYIPVSRSVLNPYYSNGEISSIVIDNKGSGYSSNSLIELQIQGEFYGTSGNVIANCRPIVNEVGQIISVVITEKGNNYKSANVIVNDLGNNGESFYKRANTVIISNNGAGYFSNVQQNTTVSIYSVGTQPERNAEAKLYFVDDSVSRIELINLGSGYTDNIKSNTFITITTSGNSQPTSNCTANVLFDTGAVLKPVIYDGKIENILVEDPGIGYSGNLQTQIVLIGDGEDAKLTPYINESGQIEDIIIENRGHGYTYLDIEISGDGNNANAYANFYIGDLNTLQSIVELSAIDGGIHALRIDAVGDNFTHANVSISGDGTNFVGNVIISNNTIDKVEIINPGKDYTHANVIISGDGGNANISAILSPQGGHGFNAIEELNAHTIMIYSTINNEKNQGLFVNNDYRQYGIIRNIKNHTKDELYENNFGSSCYLANLTNKVGLTSDLKLVVADNEEKVFDVVSVDDNSTKVLLLNKNNYELQNSDVLIDKETNQTYTIYEVESIPEINKFSGDLIFIDNRTTISYSDKQLVTLKTVIKF